MGVSPGHAEGHPMTQDPDQKPPKSDARIGGMVATAVLIFLAIFTAVIIWIA
jgi:hypothetical protein